MMLFFCDQKPENTIFRFSCGTSDFHNDVIISYGLQERARITLITIRIVRLADVILHFKRPTERGENNIYIRISIYILRS